MKSQVFGFEKLRHESHVVQSRLKFRCLKMQTD
jgi:hypothetical protein